MNRALRRQHLAMVVVLAALTLAILALAIGARHRIPASAIPSSLVGGRAR